MKSLDKNEAAILALVQQNARLSNLEIAERLQLDEKTVLKSIEKLESSKMLLGYQAIVSPNSAGKIRAFVELSVQPQKKTGYDTIAQRIFRYPQVIDHYLFSGAYDFLVVVEGDSHYEIASFVADKLATIEQVTSTVTHFVFKCYKLSGIPLDLSSSAERLAVMA